MRATPARATLSMVVVDGRKGCHLFRYSLTLNHDLIILQCPLAVYQNNLRPSPSETTGYPEARLWSQ